MSNKKKFKELTDLAQKIAKEHEPAFLKLRIKELEDQLEWEVDLKKALLKKQEEWCQWKLEMREELATANHCWGVVSERLDWLEDRMAPENAGKSFVIELCDDYRDRFFEIKEDAIQSPPNRKSRPAKTARIKK